MGKDEDGGDNDKFRSSAVAKENKEGTKMIMSGKPIHPADTEVPSATVLETAYNKVSKHMSLEDFFVVWRACGHSLSDTMLRGRGCKIVNFGLLGYNTRNEAGFFLDQVFEQTNRVGQKGKGNMSNTVFNSKLNLAALAQDVGLPSRLCQHVVESTLATAADFIKQECSVALSFQPLGIFTCNDNNAAFRFSAEFKEKLSNALKGIKPPAHSAKKIPPRGQVPARPGSRPKSSGSAPPPTPPVVSSGGDFFGADKDGSAWPPKVGPSPAHSSRGGSQGSGRRGGGGRPSSQQRGNLLVPTPERTPTPRLSKSAQMKLKADNLKKAKMQELKDGRHRKGAREMASNARKAELEATVSMLRNKIIVRGGVYGIRGLGRLLRSMDDDGTGDLSRTEMKNGFIDMGIRVSPQQLEDIFIYFDKDGSGAVSFGEFMEGLRGELTVERLLVINQAFDAIDESQDGDISISEIKKRYNCKNHPAILDRTATREQVVKEFLGQWDKARSDGTIDRDDFVNFYHDMSASITDDEDFEYMMEDTWNFEVVRYDEDGGEVRKFEEEGEKAAHDAAPADPYHDDIKEVCDIIFTPPCTFDELITRVGASQVSNCPSLTLPQFMACLGRRGKREEKEINAKRAAELTDSVLQSIQKGGSMIDVQKLWGLMSLRFGGGASTGSVIDIVKAKMLSRAGSDGLRAIHRVMRIMDDDGSKSLTKLELKNGLADWGLPLNIREIDSIFTFFDRDNSGSISFDEFLKGLRGPMSDCRKALVNLAFDVVDATGDNQVTVDDLKGIYDCSGHPGIIDGSMTEEDVLGHFVDAWDQGDKDGVVTREEFMEYYADVGASIDGDEYFELMIRNAWHISGGEGAAENSANKKVLCRFKDGTEEVVTVKNDLGLGDPKAEDYEVKVMRQLKKEKAGEKHGGVVKIDVKGEGFEKKKKEKK